MRPVSRRSRGPSLTQVERSGAGRACVLKGARPAVPRPSEPTRNTGSLALAARQFPHKEQDRSCSTGRASCCLGDMFKRPARCSAPRMNWHETRAASHGPGGGSPTKIRTVQPSARAAPPETERLGLDFQPAPGAHEDFRTLSGGVDSGSGIALSHMSPPSRARAGLSRGGASHGPRSRPQASCGQGGSTPCPH